MRGFITDVFGVADAAIRNDLMDQWLDTLDTLVGMQTDEELDLEGASLDLLWTEWQKCASSKLFKLHPSMQWLVVLLMQEPWHLPVFKSMKIFHTIKDDHTEPTVMPAVSKALPVLKWLEMLDTTL